EAFDKWLIHRLVHVEALGGGADLPAIQEGTEGCATGGYFDRGGGHHDEWIVARCFDQGALVESGAALGNYAAGLNSACERNHMRIVGFHELLADACAA